MNDKLLALHHWMKDNNFKKESMALMRIIKTSMIIRGEGSDGIVAYKEYIWRMDSGYDAEIDEATKKEISTSIGIDEDLWTNHDDLAEVLHEESRSDVLIGTLSDNILYLQEVGALSFDPKSSILIKKVVKALGAQGVESPGHIDNSDRTYRYEIKGDINDIGYHGTTEKYLRDILSLGIKPGESETNYPGIVHNDAVFFSSKFSEAQHHATHAVSRPVNPGSYKKDSIGGDPMIIEFEIPDKDLIIPDYDVDMGSENTGRYDYVEQRPKEDGSKMKGRAMPLSREMGIYGYSGRIPASFIKAYYILLNSEQTLNQDEMFYASKDDYTRLTPDEALNYMNSKSDTGFGTPELIEYEEEEEEEEEEDEWEYEEVEYEE
jgi:hypothetical protein